MRKFVFFLILFFIGCNSSTTKDSNDPLYYQQWDIHYNKNFFNKYNFDKNATIHADKILDVYKGRGVKIAVIDDDIDIFQPDLKIFFIDKNISTNFSHGTAVSGIINAQINNIGIRGIAPEAKFYFFHLPMDKEGNIDDVKLVEMFYKIYNMGIKIVNCSWGTGIASDAERETIKDLSKKGVIFIFAAGNNDTYLPLDESQIKEVISVGSSDEFNNRAYYSNYGKNLDILAPGGDIYGIPTTDRRGKEGYTDSDFIKFNSLNRFKGTSAAAPIISASIALLKEINSSLNYLNIEKIFKLTSDKIGNVPYNNGRNDYYGYGKLNLQKAINYTKFNY